MKKAENLELVVLHMTQAPDTGRHVPTVFDKCDVPCTRKLANPFGLAIVKYLRELGYTTEATDKVHVSIDEGLTNGADHAGKNNPDSTMRLDWAVLAGETVDYLLAMIHYPGEGFDAHTVRLDPRDENGKVWMGVRGRGHIFMKWNAISMAYDNYGRDYYMLVPIGKPEQKVNEPASN